MKILMFYYRFPIILKKNNLFFNFLFPPLLFTFVIIIIYTLLISIGSEKSINFNCLHNKNK